MVATLEALPWPLRKLLALAILAGGIAGLAHLVVMPVLSEVRTLREDIEAERVLRGRYGAALAQAARTGSGVSMPAAATRGFLEAPSEAIGLASLQATVTGLVGRARVQARSVAPLNPRERAGLRLVGLRVQASAPLDRVQQLLHALASAEPYLLVETVQITARPTGTLGGEQREADALELRFDIWAALRRKEAP